MNSKQYDVFLLDADGTLFNFDMAEARALKAVFEINGFAYSDNVLSQYRAISKQLWADFEKGNINIDSLQSLRFSRLFEERGVHCNDTTFNQEYLLELGKGTFLIDGAEEICREITAEGRSIYIITNGIYQVQKARIGHSPLKDYISGYFVSEMVGFQKPDIGYFDYVFSQIACKKENTLIVGDSLTADIAGGINAGVDTCWFNEHNAENFTEIRSIYEITSLYDLRRFLR